jgi:hypothetical protein
MLDLGNLPVVEEKMQKNKQGSQKKREISSAE